MRKLPHLHSPSWPVIGIWWLCSFHLLSPHVSDKLIKFYWTIKGSSCRRISMMCTDIVSLLNSQVKWIRYNVSVFDWKSLYVYVRSSYFLMTNHKFFNLIFITVKGRHFKNFLFLVWLYSSFNRNNHCVYISIECSWGSKKPIESLRQLPSESWCGEV